jgi:hypothetical protein
LEEEYFSVLKIKMESLAKSGIEDLNLRGRHLILSVDHSGRLIRDEGGIPKMRICTFQFLREPRRL